MIKLTIVQLLLTSSRIDCHRVNSDQINLFSVKDLYKNVYKLAGVDMDTKKESRQSLVQNKKGRKRADKPVIALYLQESASEGWMDEFMEKDEKEALG